MFRENIMGKRGGGVLLYIKETRPASAYEVQLQKEEVAMRQCGAK